LRQSSFGWSLSVGVGMDKKLVLSHYWWKFGPAKVLTFQGFWRNELNRPVLKHGPRSLTCMRVLRCEKPISFGKGALHGVSLSNNNAKWKWFTPQVWRGGPGQPFPSVTARWGQGVGSRAAPATSTDLEVLYLRNWVRAYMMGPERWWTMPE